MCKKNYGDEKSFLTILQAFRLSQFSTILHIRCLKSPLEVGTKFYVNGQGRDQDGCQGYK